MGTRVRSDKAKLESERVLVRKARQGDKWALNRLFEVHYTKMLGLALRYTRDLDRAYDVLQESCVKVMQNIADFRGDARFSSWMGSIVINSARLQYRQARRYVTLGEHGNTDQCSVLPSPEKTAQTRQRLGRAVEYLRDGRDGDYQLFVRRYIVGQSLRSISQEMGLSVPSVKTRVHRARARLKSAMDG